MWKLKNDFMVLWFYGSIVQRLGYVTVDHMMRVRFPLEPPNKMEE